MPPPSPRSSLLPWGRLLRLSLAPSAAADIAAGLVVGASGSLPRAGDVLLLILASLCVYHGGMALNDWADRHADARERPERPLPARQVAPDSARNLGLALLILGPLLATGAAPRAGLWMACIAALALLYDLAGRGPLLGPLLLAACRAGNLGAGVFFAGWLAPAPTSHPPPFAWSLCVLYAAYVFCASRLGRLEDQEDARPLDKRPSHALLLGAGILACLPFLDPDTGLRSRPDLPALLIAGTAAAGLASTALRTRAWTRALAGRATGQALRRLLAFTGACALLGRSPSDPDGWIVAGACLAGYPLSFLLRRVFPPT